MQRRFYLPVLFVVSLAFGVTLPGYRSNAQDATPVSQLAIWTFDGSPAFSSGTPIAPTAASKDTPTLTLFDAEIDENGKEGQAYTDVKGVSHPADRAAAWNDIKKKDAPDAEILLKLDTTGWYDLSLRFDYKSESAVGYNLGYSLDGGGSWQPILGQDSLVNGFSWQTKVIDLTNRDAIENQSSLWLRIDHLEDTGNDKFVFDNLELYGSNNANPNANRPTIKVAPSTTKYLRLPDNGQWATQRCDRRSNGPGEPVRYRLCIGRPGYTGGILDSHSHRT